MDASSSKDGNKPNSGQLEEPVEEVNLAAAPPHQAQQRIARKARVTGWPYRKAASS